MSDFKLIGKMVDGTCGHIRPPASPCCDCRERLEKLVASIEAMRGQARGYMEVWKATPKHAGKIHFRAMGAHDVCKKLLDELT